MMKSLLLSVLSIAACGICSASSLYVTATGTFSSSDAADTFVVPGDTFGISFVVSSNPASNNNTVAFDVPVLQLTYDLNGKPVSVPQSSEITFYTAADGGGFAVQFASAEFIFGASQLFTGTTAAPVFSPGTFTGQNYTFFDSSNVDANSAVVTIAPTPEPSSLLLLFCGGIGLLAQGARMRARRRK